MSAKTADNLFKDGMRPPAAAIPSFEAAPAEDRKGKTHGQQRFPVEIRALGVGLPYAISVSILGGTTEFVALYCKSIGHESWYYAYVSALVFCTLLVYVTMRDTRKYSLIDRD